MNHNKIYLQVVKLFYAANIPFNVAEQSQFKEVYEQAAVHWISVAMLQTN